MNDEARRIVDVVIDRESVGVTSANFQTPLFMRSTSAASAKVETFQSAKDVGEIYTTSSPEYYASVAHFGQVGCPKFFKIATPKTGDATTTAKLTTINAIDSDWYGLTLQDITPTVTNDAASWCGTNYKFLFTGDKIPAVLDAVGTDTTSAPYYLNLNSRTKSHCLYNTPLRDVAKAEAGYADVAFASMTLGKTVGSYTTFGKNLKNMHTDKLSGTAVTTLKAKNTSFYTKMYGLDITEGAKTCGGSLADWVDVEIGIDWLTSRIQESVFATVVGGNKISYTEEGVAKLKLAVDIVLNQAVRNELLASYEITTAPVGDQSQTDKNNRVYNGITWTATLAGAIHSTTINGKVSV